jgi:hypothetical protein
MTITFWVLQSTYGYHNWVYRELVERSRWRQTQFNVYLLKNRILSIWFQWCQSQIIYSSSSVSYDSIGRIYFFTGGSLGDDKSVCNNLLNTADTLDICVWFEETFRIPTFMCEHNWWEIRRSECYVWRGLKEGCQQYTDNLRYFSLRTLSHRL